MFILVLSWSSILTILPITRRLSSHISKTQPNPTQPVLYQTPQKEFLTGAVAYSVTTLRQPTVRLNIYRQVPNHTGFLGS